MKKVTTFPVSFASALVCLAVFLMASAQGQALNNNASKTSGAKAASNGSPAGNPNVTYTYQDARVFEVATGLGIATQLVLDPSEKILDFGTGFSAGWDIVRRDHIFYLKPKDPDAETNMYVRTDRRSYIFDLKIVSKDWRRLDEAKLQGVMYSVQFNYPDNMAALRRIQQDQAAAQRAALQGLSMPVPDPAAPARSPYLAYHTDYDSAASASAKWLSPVRVYDDSALTYVQFNKDLVAPAFFGRMTDRGEEFVLNSNKQGAIYVIHGVFPFLIIRHGGDVVAVRRR
jgi:type IV secretion system protein VirB9